MALVCALATTTAASAQTPAEWQDVIRNLRHPSAQTRLNAINRLGEAGYGVRAYTGAADFRHRVAGETVDFVLLDLVLPDGDGLSLLEWLRHSAYGRLPVIVVTTRATEDDIVSGLRGGADDYCVEPVRRNELLARIEAVLRRAGLGISDGVLRHAPSSQSIDFPDGRLVIAADASRAAVDAWDYMCWLAGGAAVLLLWSWWADRHRLPRPTRSVRL